MLQQNLIISLPTYPKFCWYATGTTHIFHLGLKELPTNFFEKIPSIQRINPWIFAKSTNPDEIMSQKVAFPQGLHYFPPLCYIQLKHFRENEIKI